MTKCKILALSSTTKEEQVMEALEAEEELEEMVEVKDQSLSIPMEIKVIMP